MSHLGGGLPTLKGRILSRHRPENFPLPRGNLGHSVTIDYATELGLVDDFESGLAKWQADSVWGVSSASPKTGAASLVSTIKAPYENNVDSRIEFKFPFDISQLTNAHIAFWTKYFIEQDKDFGYIEASSDDGQTWIQLGDPFTGVQPTWRQDFRSLDQFCESGFDNVRLRFRFTSDSDATPPALGWYIDDLEIYPNPVAVRTAVHTQLPKEYTLSNNYPNPFNPSTAIRFELPKHEHVQLAVYNLLGQKVARLVDNTMQVGSHTVRWDGRDHRGCDLPTGVYVIELRAGGRVLRQKAAKVK